MRNLTLRDPSFQGASLLSVTNTPLFNFPFSGNRTLTDTVSGGSLITFSRAGATATFTNSSGILQIAPADAARFDTSPTTLESLGLLVEDQKTNSSLRSEELDNTTSWQRAGLASISANAVIAPNGATAAESLVETTGVSELHRITQTVSITSGTVYTASIYFKQEGRRYAYISLGPNASWNNQGANSFFDLQTGIVSVSTNCTARIQALSNGFYRCTVTATPTATNATANMAFGISSSGSTFTYTGDGRSAITAWGSMFEVSLFASSYVPTGTSTVTRNDDLANITNANAALIAAIRTIFVEFRSPAIGTRGVLSLNDGTANNRVDIQTSGTAVQVLIVTGGTTITIAAGTITAGARTRLAVRIGNASSSASLNGAAPVTAAVTKPTVDRAGIGRTQAGDYLVGTIATITAWNQEFSDSMLVYQST